MVFRAAHDAYVRSTSPTKNYGRDKTLRLLGSGSDAYRSYLKFSVSGVSGTVQRATLRWYVVDGSNMGGAVFAVSNNYAGSGTAWVETGIKWNNAPALSGSALATRGSVNSNTWVEYDVTAAVNGNGTFSFGLASTLSDSLRANADESASNRPELVLTVGAP